MAVDVRSQACSYYRNDGINLVSVTPGEDGRAAHVIALVRGVSRTYQVTFGKRGWSCTCGEADSCAHVASVQKCTGHDGLAAAKPRRAVSGRWAGARQ